MILIQSIIIFILTYSSYRIIMGNCFKLPKEDKKVYNNYYEQAIQKIKLNKEIEKLRQQKEIELTTKTKQIQKKIEKNYIILE